MLRNSSEIIILSAKATVLNITLAEFLKSSLCCVLDTYTHKMTDLCTVQTMGQAKVVERFVDSCHQGSGH